MSYLFLLQERVWSQIITLLVKLNINLSLTEISYLVNFWD